MLVSYQLQCVALVLQLLVRNSLCVDVSTIYPSVILLLLERVMHYIYPLQKGLEYHSK